MLPAGLPEPELVELQRADNDSPLGIQIRTSRSRPGIYVHYLVPGSTAEGNGGVLLGDRILEANGCDMRNATVDDAASFMTVRAALVCSVSLVLIVSIYIGKYI